MCTCLAGVQFGDLRNVKASDRAGEGEKYGHVCGDENGDILFCLKHYVCVLFVLFFFAQFLEANSLKNSVQLLEIHPEQLTSADVEGEQVEPDTAWEVYQIENPTWRLTHGYFVINRLNTITYNVITYFIIPFFL